MLFVCYCSCHLFVRLFFALVFVASQFHASPSLEWILKSNFITANIRWNEIRSCSHGRTCFVGWQGYILFSLLALPISMAFLFLNRLGYKVYNEVLRLSIDLVGLCESTLPSLLEPFPTWTSILSTFMPTMPWSMWKTTHYSVYI